MRTSGRSTALKLSLCLIISEYLATQLLDRREYYLDKRTDMNARLLDAEFEDDCVRKTNSTAMKANSAPA